MVRKTATLVLLLALGTVLGNAQTQIKLPKNSYTPAQDVELGKKAAAEARKEYPVIDDATITRYLSRLGDRLVAVAPRELNQPVYEYSFTPLNVKDINAFALPGGPMFVNRGMFDAAKEEAEVAGVMAHELSHVLLRHGTANASKAQNPWLQLGQLAGIIGGAVVGGSAGSAIIQGSQFGLGTILLKYSRDFEKQADLLGAQLMARAGYDPRALARMFETIEKQSKGSSGPQWLSSHPNPGNRTAYITKEAEQLTIARAPDAGDFPEVKRAFASLPPAKSSAELAKRNGGGSPPASVGTPGRPVPAPSGSFRNIGVNGIFQASVPSNWTGIEQADSIKFVPQNAYGPMNGQTVFTHGVEFGVANAGSRDLREATATWLSAVREGNPQMRISGEQQSVRLSQRNALATPLSNPSPLGGEEWITVYTTFLNDGSLFYYLTLVPARDAPDYDRTFDRITSTVRLTDRR
jgi:Zn-dependent protease with chaperone function